MPDYTPYAIILQITPSGVFMPSFLLLRIQMHRSARLGLGLAGLDGAGRSMTGFKLRRVGTECDNFDHFTVKPTWQEATTRLQLEAIVRERYLYNDLAPVKFVYTPIKSLKNIGYAMIFTKFISIKACPTQNNGPFPKPNYICSC